MIKRSKLQGNLDIFQPGYVRTHLYETRGQTKQCADNLSIVRSLVLVLATEFKTNALSKYPSVPYIRDERECPPIKGRPPSTSYRGIARLALGDDRRGSLALANEAASEAQRGNDQCQCNRNFFHGSPPDRIFRRINHARQTSFALVLKRHSEQNCGLQQGSSVLKRI